MAGHLFISYSTVDAASFAVQLANKLAMGPPPIPVWLDKRELRPGEDWDEQIVEAIQGCAALLFVMTKDSAQPESVCKDEWVRALKYKKPVIPLLVERGAELPFRLGSREYIDFTGPLETALARLRDQVEWLQSTAGQLQQLRYRLADAQREIRRAAAEQVARIKGDIADLQSQITHLEAIVANPAAAAQQVEERVERGQERERVPAKPLSGIRTQTKFVNPSPAVPPTWFRNRHSESERIARFLKDDGLRLMTVVGRGGSGKSAMVCRLLKFLERGQLPDDLGALEVDGIVYLSNERSSHPVTVAELYTGLRQLLPEQTGQQIDALYRSSQVSTRNIMEALSEAFSRGRTIVLMDNFEDSLDSNEQITSTELNDALIGLLELPFHGLKVIITTRVAPVTLAGVEPGRQRRLDLEKGLEHPFAEEALRAMDEDGLVGFRDALEEMLSEARERTTGNPRALEHLYGILAADRGTTLQEILNDTKQLLPEKVIDVLVGEAFNRLDVAAQRVMQALASYRHPVPPVAVDYLLQPYVTGVDSAPILKRLVNMQFARRDSGRHYLHPIDREYALTRIPEGNLEDKDGQPPVLSRLALTHQAAEWYKATRKPREDWKNLEDLAPQLQEYELRVAAGEADDAAAVLAEISSEYLNRWGHFGLMIELHGPLQGTITDPELAAASALDLGYAHLVVGQYSEAIACHERVLSLARENGHRETESYALTGLGSAYSSLGENARAIGYYEAALAVDRELSDRRGEATNLMGLANEYSRLGQELKAIESYQTALVISREIQDRLGEASILGNLGDSYRILGHSAKALKCLDEACRIARDEGYAVAEIASLCYEGEVYFAENDFAQASTRFRAAIDLADRSGAIQFQCGARMQLAWVYLLVDELPAAGESARVATRFGYPMTRDGAFLVLGVVALRRGDFSGALSALQAALHHSDELLARNPQNTGALDVKGLAFCALALCDNVKHLDAARDAFEAALAINSASGVTKLVLQQFDALARADKTGLLAPLRVIASGGSGKKSASEVA
jgi:tetratricopeptide (TPR) repeat protein